MTFHDCVPYYLTKQNKIMELTKKDKKHINEQVRKLSFRIVEESKEYMRLYERTYYEEVIKMCQEKIETMDALKELSRKYSEK